MDSFLNDSAADVLLGPFAETVRKTIVPALWRGRPPKQQRGQPTKTLRDRWIVQTVEAICRRGFKPTRNRERKPGRQQESGCSIVAKAFDQLEIKLSERRVTRIWEQSGQAKKR